MGIFEDLDTTFTENTWALGNNSLSKVFNPISVGFLNKHSQFTLLEIIFISKTSFEFIQKMWNPMYHDFHKVFFPLKKLQILFMQ